MTTPDDDVASTSTPCKDVAAAASVKHVAEKTKREDYYPCDHQL
jgi:hypothetical protein